MDRRLASALALLLAASVPAGASIYGEDKRIEVKDVRDPGLRQLARGVPALVDNENISIQGGVARLDFSKYGKRQRLSRRERFYGQPTAAFCSAALIAPDLALTAGHCIDDDGCAQSSLVFDFAYDDTGRKPTEVPAASVVRCAEVVAREHDEADADAGTQTSDWAVIRLERPMMIRPVLTISQGPAPEPDAPLVMIGYPTGLPEKAAFGTARAQDDEGLLRAEIDAFHGNSGSPVLDARTLEIVGVLVNGDEDFRKVRPRDLVGALKALARRKRPQTVYVIPRGGGDGEGVMPAERIRGKLSDLLKTPDFDGSTR